MLLDPAAQVMLELIATEGNPPLEQMTPDEARAALASISLLQGDAPEGVSVGQREIAGVPCEVITPPGNGARPVLIWIHGGGWVVGTAAESTVTCQRLAAGAGCIVVNVDYRLAPEHPFPAAPDDCAAVTRWVLDHAAASAVIRPASPSAGTRRAATSARWWPTRCRGWSSSCWCTRPPTSRSPPLPSTRTVTGTS